MHEAILDARNRIKFSNRGPMCYSAATSINEDNAKLSRNLHGLSCSVVEDLQEWKRRTLERRA